MHHKRERGQSKEIFRLKGGTHVRRDDKGHVLVRIHKDDTCHITKRDAQKFGDRFEVVELPVTADDITVPEDEEAEINADEAQLQKTVEASTSEVDSGTVAEAMKEEAAGDTGMGDIKPSEPNPPPPPPLVTPDPTLQRDDFSSDAAFTAWKEGDYPDLSKVIKSGHNGTTYSAKDVRAVIG